MKNLLGVFRFGALGVVTVIWLLVALGRVGINRVRFLWPQPAISVILLIVGWQLGWLVADLDKYLKNSLRGNPQITELLMQWSAGVRNVVTMGVLVVLGFWLVSSSNSVLAWGVALGLQARLLWEFMGATDYGNWYRVMGREFNEREHKGVLLALGGLFLVQLLFVVKG